MSKWISVADRLPSPECDTAYAVIRSGKATVEDWEVEYQQFEQMHASITHWMPLPTVDAVDHAEELAKAIDKTLAKFDNAHPIARAQCPSLELLNLRNVLTNYREATE